MPGAEGSVDQWLRPSRRRTVVGACFGLVGSACFTAGWLTAGELTPHYSAIHQTISELARTGAPQRLLMTFALFVFGLATIAFGPIFSATLGHPRFLRISLLFIGAATLGVAVLPLSRHGGTSEDLLHELFAVGAYTGAALTPMIAGRAFRVRRWTAVGNTSLAVGACVIGFSGMLVSSYAGLFQRLGITVVVLWIAAMSILLLRQELASGRMRSGWDSRDDASRSLRASAISESSSATPSQQPLSICFPTCRLYSKE